MLGQEARELLAKLPVAIVVVAEPGVIRWLNPRAEKLLGLPPEKLFDRLVFDIVHPDDRKLAAERVGAQFSAETRAPGQYRIVRDNGTVLRIAVESVTAVIDGENCLITVMRDADA